ncbi:MAG: HesA/MoeB/ThiF family protein [Candidatus Korarchaeota archaeon]
MIWSKIANQITYEYQESRSISGLGEESRRYVRQIKEGLLTSAEQRLLGTRKVTVVGVGGLGSTVAILLVRTGVKKIRLIDHDIIEINDLHRQLLYFSRDVGKLKVEQARKHLELIDESVEIESIPKKLTEENAKEYLHNSDIIVDGLDNYLSRRIVNQVAVELKIPYIFAGVYRKIGNVMSIIPYESPCLECLYYGKLSPDPVELGVMPYAVTVIGSIEAMETINVLLGKPMLKGELLLIDLENLDMRKIKFERRGGCPVCGGR